MTNNVFAPTPPMGWNSYDYYDTTVNEEQVRANARVMAERLKEWGWEYIVIDIQWYAKNAGSMRGRFRTSPSARWRWTPGPAFSRTLSASPPPRAARASGPWPTIYTALASSSAYI